MPAILFMGIFEDNFVICDAIDKGEGIKTDAICRGVRFSLIFSVFVLWRESSHKFLLSSNRDIKRADFRKLELWMGKCFVDQFLLLEIAIVTMISLDDCVLSVMVE